MKVIISIEDTLEGGVFIHSMRLESPVNPVNSMADQIGIETERLLKHTADIVLAKRHASRDKSCCH